MPETKWEMQEPGWWTSEVGGICCYGPQKWFFWPDGKELSEPIGPWKSLREAKSAISNGE